MDLLQKLKQSRQKIIEAGGFKFTIQRPTVMDMEQIRANMAGSHIEVIPGIKNPAADLFVKKSFLSFVVDWPGMRELDIFPGGTGAAAPFDQELFIEWVSDFREIAESIYQSVFDIWTEQNEAMEQAEKKSTTGFSQEPQASCPETVDPLPIIAPKYQ